MARIRFAFESALVLAGLTANAFAGVPGAAPGGAPAQLQPQPGGSQAGQTQSSQALVGNWSANVNFGRPGGLMIANSFTADGRVQSTVTQVVRGLTISYMLTGVYQFNGTNGTLNYKWQDFSPKQTCIGGACTPAQPPAAMGVMNTSIIRFLSSTEFVATSNGASTTYVRTNTAGFPTP